MSILERIFNLDIDIEIVRPFTTKIQFKQFDYDSSFIALNFFNGETPITNISENYIIGIFKDSDGNIFVDSENKPLRSYARVYETNSNTVILPIKEEVIATVGEVLCEVVVINALGKRITTPTFKFRIERSLMDFNIPSTSYDAICGEFKVGTRVCGGGDISTVDIEKYITYEKTIWIDGVTVIDAYNMNKIEDGIENTIVQVNTLEDRFDNLDAIEVGYTTNADTSIKTIKDALDKLLYVPLTINLSSNKSTLEKGTIVTSIDFNWSYNKNIQSQMFENIELDVNIRNYNYTIPFNSNKTFKLIAKDDRSELSKTIGISFLNGRYWGVSNSNTYDDNFILSLSKELVESRSKTFTVNCGVGQYIYYCFPSRLGNPTFTVGGFAGGFDKVTTLAFTNSSGYVENYDIWKSTNDNLGTTTVVVS